MLKGVYVVVEVDSTYRGDLGGIIKSIENIKGNKALGGLIIRVPDTKIKEWVTQNCDLPQNITHIYVNSDEVPDGYLLGILLPPFAAFAEADITRLTDEAAKDIDHNAAMAGRLTLTTSSPFWTGMFIALTMWEWYCSMFTKVFCDHDILMMRTQLLTRTFRNKKHQQIKRGFLDIIRFPNLRPSYSKSYTLEPPKHLQGRKFFRWIVKHKLSRGPLGLTFGMFFYWMILGTAGYNMAATFINSTLPMQLPFYPILLPGLPVFVQLAALIALIVMLRNYTSILYVIFGIIVWNLFVLYLLSVGVTTYTGLPILTIPAVSLLIQTVIFVFHLVLFVGFKFSDSLETPSKLQSILLQPICTMVLPLLLLVESI